MAHVPLLEGLKCGLFQNHARLLAAAHRQGLLLQPRPGGELLLAHEGQKTNNGIRISKIHFNFL